MKYAKYTVIVFNQEAIYTRGLFSNFMVNDHVIGYFKILFQSSKCFSRKAIFS